MGAGTGIFKLCSCGVLFLFNFQFKIRYDMQPNYKDKQGNCPEKWSLLHWKNSVLHLILTVYSDFIFF